MSKKKIFAATFCINNIFSDKITFKLLQPPRWWKGREKIYKCIWKKNIHGRFKLILQINKKKSQQKIYDCLINFQIFKVYKPSRNYGTQFNLRYRLSLLKVNSITFLHSLTIPQTTEKLISNNIASRRQKLNARRRERERKQCTLVTCYCIKKLVLKVWVGTIANL